MSIKATLLPIFLLLAVNSGAQSLEHISTGADGALVLTTPGTYIFDPASFNPPLNPSGDNIYHFTSIQIGGDVRVKLSRKTLSGPVFWLAQGPVQIDGTIDLDGEDGSRLPSIAGAGGFPGGAPQKPGWNAGDTFKPNVFLVPLIGGAGGWGGITQGGGAGGGALLIASTTSITITGIISANGGSSTDGVGGNGGAVRLVAPLIDGSGGSLSAKGGPTLYGHERSEDGRIRFETLQNNFVGELNNTPFSQGKPFGLFLPPPPASVSIVSIGGVRVSGPEIILQRSAPLLVTVKGRNIPVGTVVKLQCFQADGSNQSIVMTLMEGTFEESGAKVEMTFPAGLSRCGVDARWELPPLHAR